MEAAAEGRSAKALSVHVHDAHVLLPPPLNLEGLRVLRLSVGRRHRRAQHDARLAPAGDVEDLGAGGRGSGNGDIDTEARGVTMTKTGCVYARV